MAPFFNNRPGYKPNIDPFCKPQRQSVRYSHVKPRIDTNVQRRHNSKSISYSEKSRTIEVKKSNPYRKIVTKTKTSNMSLYLQPFKDSRDDLILPRISEDNNKKK